MAGTVISACSFTLIYFLIRSVEQRSGEVDLSRLPVALAVPFVLSAVVAFAQPIIESAAVRGWISVVIHIVVLFTALWKYAGFPAPRSASYTAATVIIYTVFRAIWFYWLAAV